jgi:DNA helicase-2/ATP-dependent DNA helicase PcrA
MSLHKSKGLTARLVVIAGCVNGVVPTIDPDVSPQERELQRQEQRRLFFVGLTRATDTLVLSSAVRMPIGQAKTMDIPYARVQRGNAILQASSFLSELGPAAPSPITSVLGGSKSDSEVPSLFETEQRQDRSLAVVVWC